MADLAEFLLARIAEDEAVAERWPVALPDEQPPDGHPYWLDTFGHPIWAPRARVLAECEAKRLIVQRVDGSELEDLPLLGYLALPYAEHPDYQPQWRP